MSAVRCGREQKEERLVSGGALTHGLGWHSTERHVSKLV
jgi:hypothetical protein